MDMQQLREQIDQIDLQITELFNTRMELSAKIAALKLCNNMPIFDPVREAQKIRSVTSASDTEFAPYTEALFRQIMELSKAYQAELTQTANEVM